MRVQLSEKSKAEFIELIAKDSITCWFEGDEFVMPSGQGKTAKGIVLGKLLVWQHRQTEVDELQKQVDAAKQLIEDLNKCYQQDHQNKFEYWRGFADSAGILGKRLEQALKGEAHG